MNKAELVNALADRMGGNRKAASDALEAVIDTVYRTVAKGEKVTITGFGSFEKVQRAARTGRNPATGETIKVKKSVAPKFRPGQEFKNVISGAKKLPRLAATKSTGTTTRASKQTTAEPAAGSTRRTTKAAATKTTATKTAAKKAPATRGAAKKTTTRTAAKAPAKSAAKSTATKGTTTRRAAKR